MKINKSIVIYALLISAILLTTSCAKTDKNKKNEPAATMHAEESSDASFQGVLKSVDELNTAFTFINFNYATDVVLGYSNATKVYGKSGTLTIPELMDKGVVVNVKYDSETMMAEEVQVDEKCREQDNITKWSIDTEKKMITISDDNYYYDDTITVFNGDEILDVMCLNPVDKLKIYSIDKKICSVIVKEGHGYIKPVNYEDFVGGTISVSYIMNQPVTEEMLLVVREGIYEVVMENGNLKGKRTVQVIRDEEAQVDMAGVVTNPPDEGQVEFDIWPPGTDVYVNGKLINYNEPISLKYGEHSVTASLTGYTTYKGVLTVNSPNPTVIINLAEEIAEVDDEEVEDGNENVILDKTEEDTEPTTQDEAEIEYDNAHTMTVSAPEGVEVYLNGAYKGMAPCSFTKQIGTHTITLSKADSITKSYTVVVSNDGQDIRWSFPELVKK